MKSILKYALILTTLIIAFSCAEPNNDAGRAAILKTMQMQEDAWNNADIDGFMAGYWNSDSLMFVSGDHVSFGWQKVTDNYKAKYSSKELMGHLDFKVEKLDQLASDAYIMVGNWNLDRVSGPIGGKFTLLWKEIDGKWVVVIDHTS